MNKLPAPEFLERLKALYPGKMDAQVRSGSRIYIRIPREELTKIVEIIFRRMGAKFSIASALEIREGYEVLYHFTFDKLGFICTIKTLAPREDPLLDSIVPIVPGAIWIEREIHDILGVRFEGHPSLKRLVKAEFAKEDEYPFRKDFDQKAFKKKHNLPIPD